MPSLAQHQTAKIVKLLAFGDSKTRKTTSLVSLVAADFKLRILDHDNLLGPLRSAILRICPDKLDNVEARQFRDRFKPSTNGELVLDGKAQAWLDTIRMCNHWKYDDIDLGPPASWSDDCILVVDSLTRVCDAAYNLHESMTPITGKRGGEYDRRSAFYDAQKDAEKWLAELTSDRFPVNVIVIGHGDYIKLDDGTIQILPQGVGQKLSPKIPQYFPNIVYYRRSQDKYTIQLESDRMVNLANDAAGRYSGPSLPNETGLATIFSTLRNMEATTTASTKPAITKPILTLRK